jgi:hypothetical protein
MLGKEGRLGQGIIVVWSLVFPCPYCMKIAAIWVEKGQAVGTHGNMSLA